jgi:hypothetical protein
MTKHETACPHCSGDRLTSSGGPTKVLEYVRTRLHDIQPCPIPLWETFKNEWLPVGIREALRNGYDHDFARFIYWDADRCECVEIDYSTRQVLTYEFREIANPQPRPDRRNNPPVHAGPVSQVSVMAPQQQPANVIAGRDTGDETPDSPRSDKTSREIGSPGSPRVPAKEDPQADEPFAADARSWGYCEKCDEIVEGFIFYQCSLCKGGLHYPTALTNVFRGTPGSHEKLLKLLNSLAHLELTRNLYAALARYYLRTERQRLLTGGPSNRDSLAADRVSPSDVPAGTTLTPVNLDAITPQPLMPIRCPHWFQRGLSWLSRRCGGFLR